MPFYGSDFRTALRDFFSVMKFVGLLFFVPAFVSLASFEFQFIPGFIALGAAVCLISAAAKRLIRKEKETEFRHAMVTVVMVWIVTSLLGAIPFAYYIDLSTEDAVFESVSAWTTTGFTMIEGASSTPRTVLFWRSFMQWIGGIGLVVAILTGVISMGGSLYLAEAREEKIKPNVRNTVNTLWWIYILYTSVGALLFVVAGMPPFDAVNHSMTAIATGGMSVRDASMGYYHNFWIEAVAMLLMVAGAVSFLSHYQLLKGRPGNFFRDVQLRMMLAILVIGGIAVVPWTSLRSGFFHAVSAMTCTGLATADLSAWPEFPLLVLIALMIIGGSSGSTSGAIKMFRVGILFKSLYWNLRKLMRPHVVLPMRFGSWKYNEEEVRTVLMFSLLYLVFLLAGTLILVAHGYGGTESLFEVASAQGNVGLSMGLVNKDMGLILKIMLMVNMLVGRLEIWAILVTLGIIFMRR